MVRDGRLGRMGELVRIRRGKPEMVRVLALNILVKHPSSWSFHGEAPPPTLPHPLS